MMPAFLSGDSINIMAGRRKNPLPSPFFGGVGILSLQGVRQRHTTQASLGIFIVLAFHSLEVFSKRFRDRPRQRIAVLIALARSNHNLVTRKIDIFDS
jgi:hypothetical protein